MSDDLAKQKAVFQFYLTAFEDPDKLTKDEREKFNIVLPYILKSVIELIEHLEGFNAIIEDNQNLEKLVDSLQEKLLEQDEVNRKLSKSFKELALITDIASRRSNHTPTREEE